MIINPSDCSKYFRCVKNMLFILICPTGYNFDTESKLCNKATNVDCTKRNASDFKSKLNIA